MRGGAGGGRMGVAVQLAMAGPANARVGTAPGPFCLWRRPLRWLMVVA
ncbi:hypothetical protein ACP70R_004124 [Stipagrostis hirtigluma subsp. patula]